MSESSFQDLKGSEMAGLGRKVTSLEGCLQGILHGERLVKVPCKALSFVQLYQEIKSIPLIQWQREENVGRGAGTAS